MRLGGEPESSNFEDRTGQGSSGFGGGFGGGGLGCLLPLVMSRFGLGGVVVLLIGYFILSSLGGLGRVRSVSMSFIGRRRGKRYRATASARLGQDRGCEVHARGA